MKMCQIHLSPRNLLTHCQHTPRKHIFDHQTPEFGRSEIFFFQGVFNFVQHFNPPVSHTMGLEFSLLSVFWQAKYLQPLTAKPQPWRFFFFKPLKPHHSLLSLLRPMLHHSRLHKERRLEGLRSIEEGV